jgi:hypothetical protein
VSLFDLSAEQKRDYEATEDIKTCGDSGVLKMNDESGKKAKSRARVSDFGKTTVIVLVIRGRPV